LPLAESVRREMPRTMLQVIEGQNSSLLEWLDQGIIDVGVSFYEFHSAYVDVEPVFDDEIFVLGSAASPELASISEISFDDVTKLPLILPPSPHPLRHRVERKALQEGRRLNILSETEAASITMYVASAGMGFTLIPRAACRGLDQRGLKAVPIIDAPLMQTLVIMTSLKRPLSTCENALHRLVRFHLDAIKAETMGVAF
jgi:LysR family nitrogen assimilation transcriptional regulator